MGIFVEDFLRNTNLPKKYFDANFDISEKYKEEMISYINLLRKVDGSEFASDKKDKLLQMLSGILKNVEENFESILRIFDYYEKANPKVAQEELDDLMERLKEDFFIATIDDRVYFYNDGKKFYTKFRISPSDNFFRVRGVESESLEIQNNPNELFHIPLSKKSYTNNERFSIIGFPSLYLSSMLPLAWQECGYPKKYYYAEFQYEKISGRVRQNVEDEMKFLALYSPEEIVWWGVSIKYSHFDWWLDVLRRYIKQYPLILACSFVNHSGNVNYKQEYVIPQMLMQWVQRNNDKVNGISYFTCADISMFSSHWCAYDVVIPAQPPYDDDKYSIELKKDFCWSTPKYYQLPVVDGTANKEDREKVYTFIESIQYNLRKYDMPNIIRDYLMKYLESSICLYNLLQNGKTMDCKLMIHTMNLIKSYCGKLLEDTYEDIINRVEQDKLTLKQKEDFPYVCVSLKQIYEGYVGVPKSVDGIISILEKYSDTIWNFLSDSSTIYIYAKEKDDISDVVKWLHDNHILHKVEKLDSESRVIGQLEDICKEVGIGLDELWGTHVENIEWVREHVENIESPIFIRINSSSRYSGKDNKFYDFIHIGFDEGEFSKKLL